MSAAARLTPEETSETIEQFQPPLPESLEEAGLSSGLIEQLISKILFFRGDTGGRDLAKTIGLPFSLIDPILEFFKRHHLVEVPRSLGMGNISSVFKLTETGRKHAARAMESNQYAGVAPVPLWQYAVAVRLQRLNSGWLRRDMLEQAYRHMVMSGRMLNQLGPAINAGKSFLIYGQPGNGKTYLAEALAKIARPPIYIPYAIEFQGHIVKLFDPLYHQAVQGQKEESIFAMDEGFDQRWVEVRPPFIVSGGELTLEALDLSYNSTTRLFDAPLHMKANNGIYLIDDFGRQKVTPVEVLNRWILPMESRVDYLALGGGAKMEIPFDCFLVFSTNLKPDQLGDEAFLRRIQYKMLVGNPSEEEFLTIFDRVCQDRDLTCEPDVRARFVAKRYREPNKAMRRCQPRDILSHAIDFLEFERLPKILTDRVLDEAFESCFVDASAMEF
ncbi:MAG: hypothetical protein IT160_10680 [Bryobacterales bacterium]|nr:hypothetical protein [Bryobacterales bacterium]